MTGDLVKAAMLHRSEPIIAAVEEGASEVQKVVIARQTLAGA